MNKATPYPIYDTTFGAYINNVRARIAEADRVLDGLEHGDKEYLKRSIHDSIWREEFLNTRVPGIQNLDAFNTELVDKHISMISTSHDAKDNDVAFHWSVASLWSTYSNFKPSNSVWASMLIGQTVVPRLGLPTGHIMSMVDFMWIHMKTELLVHGQEQFERASLQLICDVDITRINPHVDYEPQY